MSTVIKIIVFLSLLVGGFSIICGQGCSNCSQTGCHACQRAFFLQNSSCQSCSTDCLTCSQREVCESCVYGHYLNGDSCRPCSNGCLSCVAQNNCTRCANTYFLSEGRCRSCPATCGLCNATACLHCNRGFFLNKTTCQFCGEECSKCSDGVGCEKCIAGYFMEEGKCKTCLDNCETCEDNSSCSKCRRGYYGKNFECLDCQTCEDTATCLQTQMCINKVSYAAAMAQKEEQQHATNPFVYPLITIIGGVFLVFYFACLVPFARKYVKHREGEKYKCTDLIDTPFEKQRDPLYEIFHINPPPSRQAPTTEGVTETNVRFPMEQSNFLVVGGSGRQEVSVTE